MAVGKQFSIDGALRAVKTLFRVSKRKYLFHLPGYGDPFQKLSLRRVVETISPKILLLQENLGEEYVIVKSLGGLFKGLIF